MNETKTIRGRNGNEVEVVTRSASKKRLARHPNKDERPLFGGPESVIGGRVQKDLDNALIYASLDALMSPKARSSATGSRRTGPTSTVPYPSAVGVGAACGASADG
jgi:hypothetical protein